LTPLAAEDTIDAAVTGMFLWKSSGFDKSTNVQNRQENER
jgi:hypothetical protein